MAHMNGKVPSLTKHRCSRCGQLAGLNHACKRANIRPTRENLTSDMKSVLQQLTMAWDGEVELAVIMCPKDSNGAVTGATLPLEKLRFLLREWERKSSLPTDLGPMHHAAPQKADDTSA